MRILVTGSRDWSDIGAIISALRQTVSENPYNADEDLTLIHSACPTGADAIAEDVWDAFAPFSPIERHPADWSRGRKAGPERNAAMVASGADICLAFISKCSSPRCERPDPHLSHGASGCADLAERAGIPTRRIYDLSVPS